MDNNDTNEQKNGNSYESSPEFHLNNEGIDSTPITNDVKIDWKSTVRKHILSQEDNKLIDEESTPWIINREDMGLSPIPPVFPRPTDGDIWKHTLDVASMSNTAFGQGGTNYTDAISEALKNMPADSGLTIYFTDMENGQTLEEYKVGNPESKLKNSTQDISDPDFKEVKQPSESTKNKNNEIVYITDGEVFHDKLTPEDREFLETQQKNTVEKLLKERDFSVDPYFVSDFTRINSENSRNDHSLDTFANRIKTVNTKLNTNDVTEDNKPKLK